MARILVMEGTTAPSRARAEALGLLSSSAIYCAAVRAYFPEIELEVVTAADPGLGCRKGARSATMTG